jgi:hypothetical protein
MDDDVVDPSFHVLDLIRLNVPTTLTSGNPIRNVWDEYKLTDGRQAFGEVDIKSTLTPLQLEPQKPPRVCVISFAFEYTYPGTLRWHTILQRQHSLCM